ncbi:FMN-binding protein [Microbacteriaceae bacterium VKM Ac-2855]|nr:FMN-binding protein [Microbacteriaceae bacterium VKM Ac-2855]
MRKRAAIASILASTAVLVGGWELGTAGTTASAPTADAGSATAGSATSGPTTPSTTSPSVAATPGTAATPAPSAQAPTPAPATAADGTYTGASESTRFGNVQVQITVSGGGITDVTALQLTDKDGRSVSISNRAAPILRSEVLAAQSADVQSVSGATYTSDAYLGSLQSAIDQAGL